MCLKANYSVIKVAWYASIALGTLQVDFFRDLPKKMLTCVLNATVLKEVFLLDLGIVVFS